MKIRRAIASDAAILTEIAFAAKRHWGYPERWIQSWKEVLTIRAEYIRGHEIYIATREEEVVGFYALVTESRRGMLEHLWVNPSAMSQGIGRSLFEHAVRQAKALGITAIEIESDPNAEKFYKRMGARRIGENVTEFEGQRRVLPTLIFECS